MAVSISEAQIVVDSRVRLRGNIPESLQDLLRAEFTYENPAHAKRVQMRLPIGGEQPRIRTFRLGAEGEMTFPRGGFARVRKILRDASVRFTWRDERCDGDLAGRVPQTKTGLYDFQKDAIVALCERENCLLRLPTGCLSPDAMIGVNRAGKSFQIRIRDLVHRFNGGMAAGKVWLADIPTMVRYRDEDGFVRLGRLADAYASGVKEVFAVRTASGHSVEATAGHRFFTPRGWKRLDELTIDDEVFVERAAGDSAMPKKKLSYAVVNGLKAHPYATRRGVDPRKGGHSVSKHRLVVEASLNGLAYAPYIRALRIGHIEGFKFLDPAVFAVHHVDEDIKNNVLENLCVKTHVDHAREHGVDGGWKHVTARTVASAVVSIVRIGERMTYDLTMAEEPHNFLANGIVVHNSGKTTIGMALAGELRVPTLVVVHSANLFEQWRARARKELGMRAEDIGIIRGGKRTLRPLTIAMQQTLAQGVDAKTRRAFGAVIFDEVQRAAATTIFDAIDPWPAKYRFGISADETRKDKKEFLIYDLFGAVAYEQTRDEIENLGHVLDVEVFVVPTDFAAPWYRGPDGDFDELLQTMTGDAARNALVMRHVSGVLGEGDEILVLTHRREHAAHLDRAISAAGYRSGLLLGGVEYAKEFARTRDALDAGEYRAGVGTLQAVGQALDIPRLATGFVVTPLAGNKQNFGQARGRICRKSAGKTTARLFYFWDRAVYGLGHLRNLIKWNNTVRVFRADGSWEDAKEFVRRERKSKKK